MVGWGCWPRRSPRFNSGGNALPAGRDQWSGGGGSDGATRASASGSSRQGRRTSTHVSSAEWRIHEPVGVFEAETAPLLRDVAKLRKLEPPPVYPSVRRDAALIVAGDATHDKVLKIVKKAAPPELEKVELFDVYEGKNLGGKKSLAYAFTYRSAKGTLTDEVVNGFQAKINKALKNGLPAEIRDH